jgi:hypothetical protein
MALTSKVGNQPLLTRLATRRVVTEWAVVVFPSFPWSPCLPLKIGFYSKLPELLFKQHLNHQDSIQKMIYEICKFVDKRAHYP